MHHNHPMYGSSPSPYHGRNGHHHALFTTVPYTGHHSGSMRDGGRRRSHFDASAMRTFESFVSCRRRHDHGGRSGCERHGEGMDRFGGFNPFMSFGGIPHRGNMGHQGPPPHFPPMFGLRGMPGFGSARGSGHGRYGFGGHGKHGFGRHGKHGFSGHGGHHMHHLSGRGGMWGVFHKGGPGRFDGLSFEGPMGGNCLRHGIRGREGGRGGRGMGRGERMPHGGRSVSEPPFSTANFAVAEE